MNLRHFVFGILLAATTTGLDGQTTHIAYVIPEGLGGNQEFNGALGMDFDVDNRVIVTKLGCFDDNSDGLMLPIWVRLFNRESLEVVAELEFPADDPGTPEREDGALVGGSRFQALAEPLTLPPGFRGTIVAEGYGPGERNANRGAPLPWTLDNGSDSLRFVGTSRYNFPVAFGAFPETPDAGPEARYGAGTFEFQTTPPELPGLPVVTAAPGNAVVNLSWPAVTTPIPAARYHIFRAEGTDGMFAQIADIAETTYSDSGLTNGVLYCYRVRGVGGNGQLGQDATTCARPFNLGLNRLVAYDTPWGVAGNQNFGGSLGMDFDVINPVMVHELGCFDDNSDGLFLPITVRLFNRDTFEILAELTFLPDDPGTPEREDGLPVGGMRFLPLPETISLPADFHGTIQADGYGDMERNANRGAPSPWSLNEGTGSLAFVGTSRYGNPGEFPATPDGGPAARYGAGTFIYETTPPLAPGKPIVRFLWTSEDQAATLVWDAVTLPKPAATYEIWRALDEAGPFTQVGTTAELNYRDAGLTNGTTVYYRVRGVGEGGELGLDSAIVSTTPHPIAGGIAYIVPEGTVGNQAFGGALGMHFDVERPVTVTRLGVFDSGSDGLFLPISARLYDRETMQVIASLDFGPGDDGALEGGSRFKVLSTPVVLQAGFHGTIVASGYGADEQNGNAGSIDLGLSTFGGGSLRFVGTSAYNPDGSAFPSTNDGGPANRYAAGTFSFEPSAAPSGLSIALTAGGGIMLIWSNPNATLERSVTLAETSWGVVPGATPGMVLTITNASEYYRLKE